LNDSISQASDVRAGAEEDLLKMMMQGAKKLNKPNLLKPLKMKKDPGTISTANFSNLGADPKETPLKQAKANYNINMA
jgi:hypothetical protein